MSLKLVAVLIATVLWATVFWSRRVEINKEVAIEVRTHKDLMVASDFPEKVVYRLSGPNAFLRVIQDRREEPIRVNLTEASAGNVSYRLFAENLKVPVGVKVLSVSPSILSVSLERVKRREVPVKLEVRGAAAPSDKISKLVVRPDRIWIKGPESVIQEISGVSTIPVELSEIKQSGEFPVPLDVPSSKVIIENGPVVVRAELEVPQANLKLKGVEIDVEHFSGSEIRLSESKATLYLNSAIVGGNKVSLTSADVRAFVDVQRLEPGTHSVKVQVRIPAQSTLVKVVPDRVNIVIK